MNETILIVEDDEDSRVYLSITLSSNNYQVLAASNGIEALEIARQENPDLVISDIMMPKMDGYELCRKMKTDSQLQAIPFIFYTSVYTQAENRDLGLSFGAARYLQKPMEPSQMLAAINDVLSEHKTGSKPVKELPDKAKEQLDVMYQHTLARMLDQKVAELEQTRDYLKNVFDSMPSLLIGVENNGNVHDLNEVAVKRIGTTLEEARGKPVWQLFSPLLEYSSQIKLSLARKQPLNLSRIKYMHNGMNGFIDLISYPLHSGDADGAVIRIDDITDNVRMEEAMIQTEKMLSVGIMAAGMAHEINNQLAGLTLGVQNILRRISPELAKNQIVSQKHGVELNKLHDYLKDRQVLEMLSGIKDSADRAGNIIENMLHFSRKSGAMFEQADISQLLDQTLNMASLDYDLKKQYDFRNIDIEKNYDSALPQIPCIPAQLKQVLLNLFRNAAQAMFQQDLQEKRAKLLVTTYLCDNNAVIEVADNGPGITQDLQQKIFEPFYTTKPADEGVGLGMFIAYFIITDTHGGHISVQSEPNQGTKFIIELPLERQA